MKYTNILEKIMCIINIVENNWIYYIFLISVVLFLILLSIKKISKKSCFLSILTVHLSLLGYTIFNYSKELGIIGDELINNFFVNIYFPSTYVYLFVITFLDVTALVSLISRKVNKAYKWVHGIFFFIMQFVSVLVLESLSKNEIDIFSKVSLFSNKELVMLLEFSINIFIAWLLTIIFVYITNLITERITVTSTDENIYENTNETVDMTTLTTDIDLNDNLNKTKEYIPTEPLAVQTPSYVEPIYKAVPPVMNTMNINEENKVVTETTNTNKIPVSSIPVNNIPVINIEPAIVEKPVTVMNMTENVNLNELIPQQQPSIIPVPIITNENTNYNLNIEKEETNNYTLNDYRIFNKMLKEIKEHNHSNNIIINKDLEYRLITKYSTETYNMFKKMLKTYAN